MLSIEAIFLMNIITLLPAHCGQGITLVKIFAMYLYYSSIWMRLELN